MRYITAKEFTAAIKKAKALAGTLVVLPDSLVDVQGPVCVIAYRGEYKTSRVAAGWSPTGAGGTLAIVVVRLQKLDVVTTVVLYRPPLRLVRVFPSFF